MSTEIRTIDPADLPLAQRVLERAFGAPNPEETWRIELGVLDAGRLYGAYDGAAPVGTAASLRLRMTVPGATCEVAGVTWVAVEATHRRQGVTRSLMQRQLTDLHEAGEPVAALFASEGAIYQRFGYGPACWALSLTVPAKAAFRDPVERTQLRIAEPDRAALRPIYDALAPQRSGWYARDDAWWDYRLFDPEANRNGAGPLTALLAEDGYALYQTQPKWDTTPAGVVHVREVVASTPRTEARLWRHLVDLDLMGEVKTGILGTDTALLHLLAEPRAARPVLSDNLYVRLVDLPDALGRRRYPTECSVVLDVADPLCPWNEGRWRLDVGPGHGGCERTTEPAELALGIADLGAAFLGGTTLTARAAAGRVTELRPGTLAQVSPAFGWPGPAPVCPLVF